MYSETRPRGTLAWLAAMLGVSQSYVSQLAAGRCPISPARCVVIEFLTRGVVKRRDLRPHDWREIWPELWIRNRHLSVRCGPEDACGLRQRTPRRAVASGIRVRTLRNGDRGPVRAVLAKPNCKERPPSRKAERWNFWITCADASSDSKAVHARQYESIYRAAQEI